MVSGLSYVIDFTDCDVKLVKCPWAVLDPCTVIKKTVVFCTSF